MRADTPATVWTPVTIVKKLCANFGTFTKVPAPPVQQTGSIFDLHKYPMPTVSEIVRYENTAYVEFQRRNNSKRGQVLTTVAFIKNILSLIRSFEKSSAIICYEDSVTANSICHPNYVPMDQEEFIL